MTLNGQLCFALHSASRAMTACYRPLLREIGLTYSQYVVMLVLWEHVTDGGPDDGGTVSLGFVCEQLHLDSATLSPLLKRLESRGIVVRRRSALDERALEIGCTLAGRALFASAVDVQSRVEQATGLTSAELADMRRDLHRLGARLRAAEARGVAAG